MLDQELVSQQFQCIGPPSNSLVLSMGKDFHITMTNSMIRAIASVAPASELLGRNDCEAAQVDSWLCFLWHSIELPLHVLNESPSAFHTVDEGKTEIELEGVKSQLKTAIETVEAYLTKKQLLQQLEKSQPAFFVGESITLADICLAVSLKYCGGHLMLLSEPESMWSRWFKKIENECLLEDL